MKLTIGMAVYDEYDGAYFTIQALRMYQDLTDCEIVVVDNFGCKKLKDLFSKWLNNPKLNCRLIIDKDIVGTSHPRQRVFEEAKGDAVLCMDSHVFLAPNSIHRLKNYFQDNLSKDLISGPLVYDDLSHINTHWKDVWSCNMWGQWDTDPRVNDPNYQENGFEIPMMGLGIFAATKETWLKVGGFNPKFKGFGGEEGYIHQKFRNAGGKCLCLPWLRWVHRFRRSDDPLPYPSILEDRFRNYIIGHHEIGLPLEPIINHFRGTFPLQKINKLMSEALGNETVHIPQAPKIENKIDNYAKIAQHVQNTGYVQEWGSEYFKNYIRTEQYNCETRCDSIILVDQNDEMIEKAIKTFKNTLVIIDKRDIQFDGDLRFRKSTIDGKNLYILTHKHSCEHTTFHTEKVNINRNIGKSVDLSVTAQVRCLDCKQLFVSEKASLVKTPVLV